MKILFGFHLESNSGYALSQYERLFYRLGCEIAEGGAEGTHFSFTHFEKGHPRSLPGEFIQLIDFDYQNRSSANLDRLAEYCRAHQIDTALFVDLDAVHPVVSRLRKAGVSKILGYWGAPISSIQPPWKLALKRAHLAMSSNRLDTLIFESDSMARTATHGRGFPASGVRINPLGVDPDRWNPNGDRDYVYQALGIDPRRKIFVFSGHMEERKGIPTLIEAAIEVLHRRGRKDVFFLICGNRPGESERYEARYAGLEIEDGIRFGGYRDDLPRLYPGCYSGVLPSSGWDSYTYGAVEMASSGLPIIASKLQGLAEAVVDGVTGWHVTPGDSKDLADRIEWVADHPEAAAAAGRAGRARIERELTVEHQFQRMKQIILQ